MTPAANRKHIALFGETNAGKSALFNALLGQQRTIVSATPGTTTDAVSAAVEWPGVGAVTLTDTAGLADTTALGPQREAATRRVLSRCDAAVLVSATPTPAPALVALQAECTARGIPFVVALSKADAQAYSESTAAIATAVSQPESVDALRRAVAELLSQTPPEPSLLAGLLPPGAVVVLVAPVDSAAPKGRLILPQAQLIRDALDNGLRCHVCQPGTLPAALAELPHTGLVVTDAQAFREISVPPGIPLTSFSMLMARQKGDFAALLDGARALARLQDGDRVLIAEACTHAPGHEDIGRVQIPRALGRIADVACTFAAGRDFPLEDAPLPREGAQEKPPYALVVHCGGCMLTRREYLWRQALAARHGIPMTNYGMVLAHAAGVLERSVEILRLVSDNANHGRLG